MIVVDNVAGNSVHGFKCLAVFGAGDLDGGVIVGACVGVVIGQTEPQIFPCSQ